MGGMGLLVGQQCSGTLRMRLLLLLLFGFLLFLAPRVLGELDLSESVTCLQDRLELELPGELGNHSWRVRAVDASGEEMMSCEHTVDYEKLLLRALLVNCTSLEHGQHQLRLLLLLNGTVGEERNVTYSAQCSAARRDEIIAPLFVGVTECTKDSMAVTFPGPSLSDEHPVQVAALAGTLTIDDGIRVHQLSLEEATQHGYSFLTDGHHLVFQAAFTAIGVVSYKHNQEALYTAALKLTYGPPEHRLTVESRMLCAPGSVLCNTTHMAVAIPAFPGTLMAVAVEDETIPKDQLQDKGITLNTTGGVNLLVSRAVLKSALRGESCPGVQSYLSFLKLTFHFHGETVAMVMRPECPCDQHAPIAAVCTQDGYMDFEVLAGSTTPPLALDTLRLRDPMCKPAFRSPSNDRAWFHVPLSRCGTRYWLEGEKIMYENEVRALRSDHVLYRISRDSEFRLTVLCSFSNGDASISVGVENPPPLAASMNQGPLSLIFLSYPGLLSCRDSPTKALALAEDSYRQPYRDDQYPIVRYLQQPIFMEVQVLNRNDPNLHLQLDDCWATASEDPSSLPQWNIVVDGCEYDQDSYRTAFHAVGRGVSYPNYRQRLEVKAFAFVLDKALPGLVYFHCSALLCDHFQPDSPLCTARCPRPHRSKRGGARPGASSTASLQGPVLLVPRGWAAAGGDAALSRATWAAVTAAAVGVLSLAAAMLLFTALLKCLKRRALMVNAVY
ncbi:zona pellucida sperm-binding protein 2 isoform X1 [Tympanuchus pallidicinctus]|uniref:zona pellucida sperm-binding protein 2 isoform X1 n=1 Tax=Tympanuchus pallidicinctus TaxID=109042 RepID=UPI00228732F5|nr:zona pellucida sperm-binding protein 2 isoform X1 [Tympanuchus pallidicinctus]